MPNDLSVLVNKVIDKFDSEVNSIKVLAGDSDEDDVTNISTLIGRLISENQKLVTWQQEFIKELQNNSHIKQYVSPGIGRQLLKQQQSTNNNKSDLESGNDLINIRKEEVEELERNIALKKQQQAHTEEWNRKISELKSEIEEYRGIEKRCDMGELTLLENNLLTLKTSLSSKKLKIKETENNIVECNEQIRNLVDSIHNKSKEFSDLDGVRQLEKDLNKVIAEFESGYDKQQVANVEALRDRIDFTKSVSGLQLTKYSLDKLDDITHALDKIDDEIRKHIVAKNDG